MHNSFNRQSIIEPLVDQGMLTSFEADLFAVSAGRQKTPDKQAMRSILVTGGAGFIGSNFIRYILRKYPNYRVVNYDLLTYAGNLENLRGLEDHPGYSFVKGNIRNRELLDKVIQDEKIDLIVHFAAESHVDRSILEPEDFLLSNVIGTHVLLRAARENGNIRFHHISTDEVFGSLETCDPPFCETTAYDPRSPYSASKAASDHIVRAYWHTYGLPVTLSNCTNNYGPYMFPEKFIPLCITNLLEGKKIPLYGDGSNIRDWLHVEDQCRALDVIIHQGQPGETYCVGGETEMTNKAIAQMILDFMGYDEEMIEYVKDRPGHDRRYAMDFSRMRQEFGWQPTIAFEPGLSAMIDWYRENQEWWQRIKSGAYQNYYHRQYGQL